MNLTYIKKELEKSFSNFGYDLEDLSEEILTIKEHFDSEISLLMVDNDEKIIEIFNHFFNINKFNIRNYFLDSFKLDGQKFDVVYFNGKLSAQIINYFILTIPLGEEGSIFIFKDLSSESIKDLSEMLKLSKIFTHIIDLKDTSIFIKKPNIRMISFKELSDYSLKCSGIRPDDETLLNVMSMINGFTCTKITDDLNINFTSYINIKNIICGIYDRDKNLLYQTQIDLNNGINYWFSVNNKEYLSGFYLSLSKNGYVFYEKFFNVKNNKVVNE